MEGLFSVILKTSIYGTVVGLVILIIRGILKNKLNAKYLYIIWFVLILKLVVPFGPGSTISLFNVVPEIPEKSVQQMYYDAERVHEISTAAENPMVYEMPSPGQETGNKSGNMVENTVPYLWAVGALAMLSWIIFTYFLFSRKLQKSPAFKDERLNNIFESCKSKMGITRNIDIVLEDSIGTPSLFGIVRPKILLPPSVLGLKDAELQYILLHEMAHYKHCDVPVNYLLLMLQTVHWFNPVMWYCFRKMRQDMELATDERVLSVLENHEHKAYGRALIAVLEGFTPPKLVPRLLGMVDDKKSIARRINMIAFFKKPKIMWSIIAVAVTLALGAVCLTSAAGKQGSNPEAVNNYDAEVLYKYKSLYIGDASNVGSLTSRLPLGQYKKGMSLKTKDKPYGLTVTYTIPEEEFSKRGTLSIGDVFASNAAIIFSLIDNVEDITFALGDGRGTYHFSRNMFDIAYGRDVKEYSKDMNSFKDFLKAFGFRLLVFPEKYTPAMSSTPGIRITPEYRGSLEKVKYTTDYGTLLKWDASTGNITNGGKTLEMPPDIPAYWSAIEEQGAAAVDKDTIVTVELLDENGRIIGIKKLVIIFDGSFYTVKPSLGIVVGMKSQPQYEKKEEKPRDIDEAVSLAIKSQVSGYKQGEVATEGHIILDTEEKQGEVKVYTISSCGAFGFENGVFTKISGSGAIPTVITFAKDESGGLSLVEYKEPLDGSYYGKSKKEMFPEKLWDEVLSEHKYYPELLKQQEEQAAAYLKSIGREAEVNGNHVEKKLADINVEASNKLFAGNTKYDMELNKFPYWLGTIELVEDGVRYIYETSQTKTSDGFDMIVFKKTKEDGSLVKEYRYKIEGSEPILQ